LRHQGTQPNKKPHRSDGTPGKEPPDTIDQRLDDVWLTFSPHVLMGSSAFAAGQIKRQVTPEGT
jgi:hypothetical protein